MVLNTARIRAQHYLGQLFMRSLTLNFVTRFELTRFERTF